MCVCVYILHAWTTHANANRLQKLISHIPSANTAAGCNCKPDDDCLVFLSRESDIYSFETAVVEKEKKKKAQGL